MGSAVFDLTDQASEEDRFGSDFHRLSHELRTPLNSIGGFAELLLMDGNLSPEGAEYARAILASSRALTAAVVAHLEAAALQAHALFPEAPPAAGQAKIKRARHRAPSRHSRNMEGPGAL